MSKRNISTGIDIGTSNVRVVVAEHTDGSSQPTILGTGISEARGLRHGYIVNSAEATESIKNAVAQAEKSSGVKIKKVFIAIGGLSLESEMGSGSTFISRADNEVTNSDVVKVTESSEGQLSQMENKQILHTIPVSFLLDNKEVLGKPQEMKGSRLEVQTLFITCLTQHLNDFIRSVEDVGLNVEDIMASPLSASFVTLTRRQKVAGCALANIGAETLSIAVFENGIPISLKVFPIGGVEITNDIALGLKIPLEEAEEIKLGQRISSVPKKKLDDIISARLSDIFDLINAHLKKIGKNGLLPAGIILTGGSSGISIVEDLAKTSLQLPSHVAIPSFTKKDDNQVNDSSWAVAYGLCIMGIDSEEEYTGIKFAKRMKNNITAWLKQFLP